MLQINELIEESEKQQSAITQTLLSQEQQLDDQSAALEYYEHSISGKRLASIAQIESYEDLSQSTILMSKR